MKNYYYLIGLLLLASCFPENADDISIGEPPTASFTTAPSSDNPNRIILTNTSSNGNLASWTYSDRLVDLSIQPQTRLILRWQGIMRLH